MFTISYTSKGRERVATFATLEQAKATAESIFQATGIVVGIVDSRPIQDDFDNLPGDSGFHYKGD